MVKPQLNCELKHGGYGEHVECGLQQSLTALCTSGLHQSCDGETTSIMCCDGKITSPHVSPLSLMIKPKRVATVQYISTAAINVYVYICYMYIFWLKMIISCIDGFCNCFAQRTESR